MPQTYTRTILAADRNAAHKDFLQEPIEKFCRTEISHKDPCRAASPFRPSKTDSQDGAYAQQDCHHLLSQRDSILGADLTFTFVTREGLDALKTWQMEQRATLDRQRATIHRGLVDDRLLMSSVAAKMACRMLISYQSYALPGYRSFICDDDTEWGTVVRERGWSPHLMLTGDRLAVFTSKSGSRSFINVLFDSFAHSVKFFTEPVTFFAALAYLDRLHATYYATLVIGLQLPTAPTPLRVYKKHFLRLMVCLMIIACKMHADLKSTIGYFVRNVPGLSRCGVTTKELVIMEHEVLNALDYNATVDKTHIQALLASFASPHEAALISAQLFH